MKTDQLMQVEFSKGILPITHLTMMGDLSKLFDIGNAHRLERGKKSLQLEKWLALEPTKEYIELVGSRLGRPAIVRKRGKRGYTSAHLKLIIDAAMYLDPELKDEVLEAFLVGKLLMWRDVSGDGFIDLNASLAESALEVLGKPAHKGHFIALAKTVKQVCGVDTWNSATAQQLARRTQWEDRLATLLKTHAVKDWDHLKALAKQV